MSLATIDDSFLAQVEPLRRELTAHCYRMVGSVHDAEDLVQETYLRAWRAFHGFEHRSSLRTWMYQIATNTCMTALSKKERRTLPTGLGQPSSDPGGVLESRPEVPWLEPLPDDLVWGAPVQDPATLVVTKDSVRLAFVAALQHLTAQQRAVLVLRDVLAWRAQEVATTLEISVAAVNSALQRARAHLARLDPDATPRLSSDDQRARALIDQYVAAFEEYDVERIVSLLTEDAVWEMPPFTGWYSGAVTIGRLIANQCPAERPGDMRMVRTSANGQPALALYMRDTDGVHRAFQLQQPTLTASGVAHVVCHFDTTLFADFGLPRELDLSAWQAGRSAHAQPAK
ncbi:MAG: sigma-70 family RNA polymerase sigma factor [Sciscionella sp.]